MRFLLSCTIWIAVALATPTVFAQPSPPELARAKDIPTKVEYYYRVKWGSLKEFVALYDRNHKPLLEEMRKDGFVTDMKTEFPFTHIAGGPRWDMRVTITYRDAAAAINDPAWVSRWDLAKSKLYKNVDALNAEEAKRFSLLEDHWDVVVSDFPE